MQGVKRSSDAKRKEKIETEAVNWVNHVRTQIAEHLMNGITDHLITKIYRSKSHRIYVNSSRDNVAPFLYCHHLCCAQSRR